MPRRPPLTLALLAAATAVGAVSCGAAHAAPTPTGALASACSSLVATIPGDLVSSGGRAPRAASPYVARFGSPAVTIRCGAPLPSFDPASDVESVDGVDWLVLPDVGSSSHFAAWRSPTLLDVVIPRSYLPADVLPALSPLVARYGTAPYP